MTLRLRVPCSVFCWLRWMPCRSPLWAGLASLATPEQWETQVVFQYFADHSGDAADMTSDEAALVEDAARDIVSRETNEGQLSWAVGPASICSRCNPFVAIVFARSRTGRRLMRMRSPPTLMRSMEYPTAEEIAKAFGQEGLVGNSYKNYEAAGRAARCRALRCVMRSLLGTILWLRPEPA